MAIKNTDNNVEGNYERDFFAVLLVKYLLLSIGIVF
jgi:hypothetical protein